MECTTSDLAKLPVSTHVTLVVDDQPKRWKLLPVNAQNLLVTTYGGEVWSRAFQNLAPHDAKAVYVLPGRRLDEFYIVVSSDTFPEVPIGAEVPEMDTIFLQAVSGCPPQTHRSIDTSN